MEDDVEILGEEFVVKWISELVPDVCPKCKKKAKASVMQCGDYFAGYCDDKDCSERLIETHKIVKLDKENNEITLALVLDIENGST